MSINTGQPDSKSRHTPLAIVITDGGKRIDCIFPSRPGEVKAYDADEDQIGTYADEATAIAAISRHTGGKQ